MYDGCEVVAADARKAGGRPDDAQEAQGDRPQQAVADLVAQAVVDLLEAVEIEEENGDPGLPAGVDDAFQLGAEGRPVPEAGDAVRAGLRSQLRLGAGHILQPALEGADRKSTRLN